MVAPQRLHTASVCHAWPDVACMPSVATLQWPWAASHWQPCEACTTTSTLLSADRRLRSCLLLQVSRWHPSWWKRSWQHVSTSCQASHLCTGGGPQEHLQWCLLLLQGRLQVHAVACCSLAALPAALLGLLLCSVDAHQGRLQAWRTMPHHVQSHCMCADPPDGSCCCSPCGRKSQGNPAHTMPPRITPAWFISTVNTSHPHPILTHNPPCAPAGGRARSTRTQSCCSSSRAGQRC